MKVAIIGSRRLTSYTRFKSRIERFYPALLDKSNYTEFVSGGTKGTDSLAEKLASELGVNIKVFIPEYEKYGIKAPLVRNSSIAKYADYCVAFIEGDSRDTLDTIRKFRKFGKQCIVIELTDQEYMVESFEEMGCELPEVEERSFRAGMSDMPLPMPKYRMTMIMKIKGEKERYPAGLFFYKEDMERIVTMLSSEDISFDIEEIPV
ncbi:MAG: hypothetical protein VB075_07975 [Petrimonas sp.]|uniref:hypothetical protein n=1 Tax=Petrimonas sp. TaxID=2023866 RepID=UPI00095948C3|nr:hypothetical protein [Petrimonas sp.]MEA5044490.1 hypothetical protein [Petrimonas sp.]OJV38073.1 MAG: hypothetical protein BGO33_05135 [Bacteroidia bacterium 43-41]